MATYKVIQDIEAEDKFLGPLTLKQFVFGAGGAFFAYLSVFALSKGFPYALIVLVPPMLLGFFLAVPWSKDQPTEVWVLAKLRFMIKPRKRIWNQSGMEEIVTITAPKTVEKQLTDNLSQTEVKSRLQALAETIDSRGWAIKQANGNIGFEPISSDRLISIASLPQQVPSIDIANIPDAYGGQTSTSENFDRMIQQSTDMRMAQNLEKMDRIRKGEPLESIVLPPVNFTPPSLAGPHGYSLPSIDEASLTEELKYRRAPDALATAHMRTIRPINPYADDPAVSNQTTTQPAVQSTNDEIPEPVEEAIPSPQAPAILEYARNNDLDVATIARQAQKDKPSSGSNEVVVSLR